MPKNTLFIPIVTASVVATALEDSVLLHGSISANKNRPRSFTWVLADDSFVTISKLTKTEPPHTTLKLMRDSLRALQLGRKPNE